VRCAHLSSNPSAPPIHAGSLWLDPVRRQPPWWNELESEADVVDVGISVDPDQLEMTGRRIESHRRFMRDLDAVRARSMSWLGFLELIKSYWSNDSTLCQLMDNS
jgi:hypothetical protein